MDKQWDMQPRPLSPPRLAREHASFSAALLDAIYRSVDTSPSKRPDSKNSSSSPDNISRVPPAEFWREPRAASTDQDHKISQTALALQKYPSTPRYLVPRTSYRPPRTNRIRPDPSLPSAPSSNSPPNEEAEFQLSSKDDNYKKIKLGKKKKRSIMRLLKSFFSLKRDKKALKVPELTQPPPQPIGSSARSCMSSQKKLSEGPKRSVRFAPVPVSSSAYDGAVEKRVEELIKALAQGRG